MGSASLRSDVLFAQEGGGGAAAFDGVVGAEGDALEGVDGDLAALVVRGLNGQTLHGAHLVDELADFRAAGPEQEVQAVDVLLTGEGEEVQAEGEEGGDQVLVAGGEGR
jgi:hypothetical protein